MYAIPIVQLRRLMVPLDGGKDAECANEDLPPGLPVATAMFNFPTQLPFHVLQLLFNSVTVFPSIRTLLHLIKRQHDVQVRFEIPKEPTSPKEDLKPRFLNDLAQRFAGNAPEEVVDSLPSGPLYFDGSVHPEAFLMVETNTQSNFSVCCVQPSLHYRH